MRMWARSKRERKKTASKHREEGKSELVNFSTS